MKVLSQLKVHVCKKGFALGIPASKKVVGKGPTKSSRTPGSCFSYST